MSACVEHRLGEDEPNLMQPTKASHAPQQGWPRSLGDTTSTRLLGVSEVAGRGTGEVMESQQGY